MSNFPNRQPSDTMTTLFFTGSTATTSTSAFSETSPPGLNSTTWASMSINSTKQHGCEVDSEPLRLLLAAFYSLFFVFGLVGNLFALWVFLFLHSRRNSVRVFLINCAVADLVLLVCLPFRVFYHINGDKWVLGSVACKMVGNFFYMNMYISIALLGFISLDRYLRMKGKGRARSHMRLRLLGYRQPWSWVACGTLWTLSLMAAVAMISTPEDKDAKGKCFHYKQRTKADWKAYLNFGVVMLFWLVFGMLLVSYTNIASQLLHVSHNKPDLPNAQKFKRTAKKSFFVLLLFTVCFVPYHVVRPVYILTQLGYFHSCHLLKVVDHTNEVMLLFSAFNSCLDPVMYFLFSGSVRKTALRALGHGLGNRLHLLHDAASYSSTMDYRQPSRLLALPDQVLNNPSLTPRTSFCVINSTLRRTDMTTLPPAGRQ